VAGGSPIISGNKITSGMFYQSPNKYYYCAISVLGGSPTISNNAITSITKQQQTLTGYVDETYPGITISPNPEPTYLVGAYDSTPGQPVSITGNTIHGCSAGINGGIGGIITVEKNLLINNNYGLAISSCKEATIRDNTIANNVIGINLDHFPSVTLSNNNIEGNSQNSIFLANTTNNINAENNWWGTTDTSMIDKLIYDFNDDANLGKVNYTPFLTASNPQAIPNPNAPIPTLSPLNSPTPTPIASTPTSGTTNSPTPTHLTGTPTSFFGGNNGLELGIFIALILTIALLIVLIVLVLKKRPKAELTQTQLTRS
jgi:parallel beta-helix repeat protein